MNISFHAWRDFNDCPKKYFLKYRKRAEPTVPKNEYFTLYGRLVERFFQMFCNIWGKKSSYMPPGYINDKTKILYDEILDVSIVDWSARFVKASKNEILEQAQNDICTIMDSHQQNYFLNTKSEVEIKVQTKNDVNLTSRLDFIHTHPLDKSLLIFDGKGTAKMGKADKNQLLYYALLYNFEQGRPPDNLGFFFYRFNTFTPVDFNMDILNTFRAKISLDVKDICTRSDFEARPKDKNCRFCDYSNSCEELLKKRASRKRPVEINSDDTGVSEFGF